MILLKKTLCFLALIIGILGTLVCVALIAGVWVVNSRLGETTQNIFGEVDGALQEIRERVPVARERFNAAKITVQDIEQSLKEWSKREVGEEISERLDLSARAERLTASVGQADQWLEMTESSLKLVQQVVSASRPDEFDGADAVGAVLEEIGTLRMRLSEVEEFAGAVRDYDSLDGNQNSVRERVEKIMRLVARSAASLDAIEVGLDKFDERLFQAQLKLEAIENSTLRWIFVVALGITLLIAWMLAGQLALSSWAWKALRTPQSLRDVAASPS